MISEGSCDTEDWSHDAENVQYFKMVVIIFHNFYCIFDQINAALVSIEDFFQKHFTNPKVLNVSVYLDTLYDV